MTDKQTPPDWVLLEAAKRCGWDTSPIEKVRGYLARDCVTQDTFRALCDMILKHEQPPVDRKLLCAEEAYQQMLQRRPSYREVAVPRAAGDDGELVERLLEDYCETNDGCRVRKSIPELIHERKKAADRIEALSAEVERLEKAGRCLLPYLHWTISAESPGHHPTMPSAVADFEATLGAKP